MAAGEELVFTTAVGLNYQLEGSADLESWEPVGDPIAGDGEEVSLILGGAEPGSGLYYRIGVSIAD